MKVKIIRATECVLWGDPCGFSGECNVSRFRSLPAFTIDDVETVLMQHPGKKERVLIPYDTKCSADNPFMPVYIELPHNPREAWNGTLTVHRGGDVEVFDE